MEVVFSRERDTRMQNLALLFERDRIVAFYKIVVKNNGKSDEKAKKYQN